MTVMPLLSMRQDIVAAELGETLDDLPLLERLLRCDSKVAHEHIAAVLWDRLATKRPAWLDMSH